MYVANRFRMELWLRQYIFGFDKRSTFLLGGLFILDLKGKK